MASCQGSRWVWEIAVQVDDVENDRACVGEYGILRW